MIKSQIEKESGYKLLSKKYINNHNKLFVRCIKGHQYYVTYSHFQQGRRCPICVGNKKLEYEFVKEQIENVGYKLLSKEYKNANSKLKVECPEGHQYYVTYSDFQQGYRCPVCWKLEKYSRSEKDCLNVVKQYSIENIIENDRTQIINPKTNQFLELDIWIPSGNKAIEFNGEYWHESYYLKYKDNQKQIQCEEKNIDLLTIWYNDWIDNREKEIEKLKEFLNEEN